MTNQNFFSNCETVEEAKKQYWELAKRYHPDVGGDAETMKLINDQFQNFNPKFTNKGNEFKGSFNFVNYSQTFITIVNNLLSIADRVTVEIIGDWIWITGNTKPVKETIKTSVQDVEDYKVRFSKNKIAWYIAPADYRKASKKQYSLNEIRDTFGSYQLEQEKYQKLPA